LNEQNRYYSFSAILPMLGIDDKLFVSVSAKAGIHYLNFLVVITVQNRI
jgi:hypothetical protein